MAKNKGKSEDPRNKAEATRDKKGNLDLSGAAERRVGGARRGDPARQDKLEKNAEKFPGAWDGR